jgi:hypothetical protein
MNIVFIIGNGFDINLNLKTKYSDFYKHYKTIESENEVIRTLKENISADLPNWSDMEIALGKYTKKLKSSTEFEEIFDDIVNSLGDYLQNIEDSFDASKSNQQNLYSDLCYPENSLAQADINDILNFKNNWAGADWTIKIITLNYTKILEKMLDNSYSNLEIGSHHRSSIILDGLEHIHGYTDDRMVLGVNDTSQIENSDFHSTQEVLNALVKKQCNKSQKHTIDDKCISQINSANLICVFGSSIGDTDKYLWEVIGKRLKKDSRLIIYTKGREINRRQGHKKAIIESEMKKLFLNKTNLTEQEKNDVQDYIYIGVNSEKFASIK